jgi:membrane-associated phospholipid phosphatase
MALSTRIRSLTAHVEWRYVLILYWIILLAFTIQGLRSFTPEVFFVLFLGVVLFLGRIREYLRDWFPFLVFILAYEALRSVTGQLAHNVHITDLIAAERWLFGGHIPTLVLQARLHPTEALHWYDAVLTIFYSSHFIFAFFVAFLLWLKRRPLFQRFTRGFLLMTFAGLLTYLLYPAMPPWLASLQGHLPPVPRLVIPAYSTFLSGLGFPVVSIYQGLQSNLVAAMPSLHSAWPTYVALCLTSFFRWRGAVAWIVPVGVWFTVVYFGEHYVIDVFVGILYAVGAFLLTRPQTSHPKTA